MSGDPMTAGRELDVRIAREVMGLRVQTCPFIPRDADTRELFDDEAAYHFAQTYPSAPRQRTPPRFSTDIAAAWLVVERLIANGFYPDLISSAGSGGLWWRCVVDRFTEPTTTTDEFPVSRSERTAPLAICRAALAAALHTGDA